MGREDLASGEIDDRDLPLVDDGEDTAAGTDQVSPMCWIQTPPGAPILGLDSRTCTAFHRPEVRRTVWAESLDPAQAAD